MCGIAGFVGTNRDTVARAIAAMNRAQAHRGPDDEGLNCFALPENRWLGLGHRRLSIIDLSPAGHQPMLDPETGNALVFNGEIYNFKDLRATLVAKGYAFTSQTDTEVILKGYAEWGTEIFRRLEGMYAIGIYDARRKKLCLARDPLGIKPLYIHQHKDAILFASEVRALVQLGVVDGGVDRRALAGFLAYGAVQEPLTIYKCIRMVPPATLLQFDLTNPATLPEMTQYWTFPMPGDKPPCRRTEAVEHIRELLQRAMRRHLISDVPIGVFLSSGLDSAVLAAFATRENAGKVHSYTVALAGHEQLDESDFAEKTANAIGCTHVSVHLSTQDVLQYVKNWFLNMDQPSLDGLNTFIVAGAARECGIKVALSGLGGDELFGGYNHVKTLPRQQRILQFLACLPVAWRVRLANKVLAGKPEYIKRKAADLICADMTSIFSLVRARRRLYSNQSLRELGFEVGPLELDDVWVDGQNPARGQIPGLEGIDARAAISMIESRFYMRNMLLRDTDVMGMAHGMELRVPLLDQQIVDFVGALPGAWRVRAHGVNKPLLVDAAEPFLRATEIARRVKKGFSLPHAEWLHGPLRSEFEGKLEGLKSSGWIAPEKVDHAWKMFLSNTSDNDWGRVWVLGVLGQLASATQGDCKKDIAR